MKGFWRHDNGKMYVVESDTFGQITSAVGPVNDLHDLQDYVCKPAIVDWVREAIAGRKLHRVNLASAR